MIGLVNQPFSVFLGSRDHGVRPQVLWRVFAHNAETVNEFNCENTHSDLYERVSFIMTPTQQ